MKKMKALGPKNQKHVGQHTKQVKPDMNAHGLGSNMALKKPTQTVHVAPLKDTMAHNVGGSAAHQMVDKKSMGHQDLYETGASMKKPAKKREKY